MGEAQTQFGEKYIMLLRQQTKKEHFDFAILIKKSKGTCEKT